MMLSDYSHSESFKGERFLTVIELLPVLIGGQHPGQPQLPSITPVRSANGVLSNAASDGNACILYRKLLHMSCEECMVTCRYQDRRDRP